MLPNLTAFGPLCEHCSDRLSGMSYWTDRRPVHRSRAVDVPTLARAAVRLLDEGGMSALTMRAVASEIGVAAASLYSRVRSVEDIDRKSTRLNSSHVAISYAVFCLKKKKKKKKKHKKMNKLVNEHVEE